MPHPFDDEDGGYVVLVNAEEQYSLWPVPTDVPSGWAVTHGPADRESCLAHVRTHWLDLAPRSLARD